MPRKFNAPIYTEEQIEELSDEDIIFPFSSKYMVYDGAKRQYIPTLALLLKHGINLDEFLGSLGQDKPTAINNELEYISDQVYSYISKNSGSNTETLKWIIAKGIRNGISPFWFRARFEEILWKQARFYVDNDDPSKSTGIDIEQKQYLGKGVLMNEDRHIDPKVKILLRDLGLVWVGSYDYLFAGPVAGSDW